MRQGQLWRGRRRDASQDAVIPSGWHAEPRLSSRAKRGIFSNQLGAFLASIKLSVVGPRSSVFSPAWRMAPDRRGCGVTHDSTDD